MGTTDPLFERHFSYSPYNYVLGNPMILFDPDGRQEKPSIFNTAFNLAWEFQRQQSINTIRAIFPGTTESYFKQQALDREKSMIVDEWMRALNDDAPTNSGAIESTWLQPADFIGGYIGTKLAFSGAGKVSLTLSQHAVDQMTDRKITEEMIIEAIKKGDVYVGHKSGGFTYVLRKGAENGQDIIVGKNLLTNNIITVINSNNFNVTTAKTGARFTYRKVSDTLIGWSRDF